MKLVLENYTTIENLEREAVLSGFWTAWLNKLVAVALSRRERRASLTLVVEGLMLPAKMCCACRYAHAGIGSRSLDRIPGCVHLRVAFRKSNAPCRLPKNCILGPTRWWLPLHTQARDRGTHFRLMGTLLRERPHDLLAMVSDGGFTTRGSSMRPATASDSFTLG